MKKIKGKTRTPTYEAVQTQKDAEELIKVLGEQRREVIRIEADMNDKIALLKQQYEQQAQPYKDDISALIESVQNWAEVNRDDLTVNGKTKTVALATGELNWRLRPPKVTLRGKPRIIENLERLGLQKFIRISKDIDKEAVLKDKEAASAISGITIKSAGEDFAINPYELEIENKQ